MISTNVLRSLARAQAPARLEELNQQFLALTEERAEILREFPELSPKARRVNTVTGREELVDPELVAPAPKRRRQQSIEQRLATGRRMRAYWKKRRAEKKAKAK